VAPWCNPDKHGVLLTHRRQFESVGGLHSEENMGSDIYMAQRQHAEDAYGPMWDAMEKALKHLKKSE
jgi:hypothetical protein